MRKIFFTIGLIVPCLIFASPEKIKEGDLIIDINSVEEELKKYDSTQEAALERKTRELMDAFVPRLNKEFPEAHQAFDRKLIEHRRYMTKSHVVEGCFNRNAEKPSCRVGIQLDADEEHVWGRFYFTVDKKDFPLKVFVKASDNIEYTVEQTFNHGFKLKYKRYNKPKEKSDEYDLQVGVIGEGKFWAIKTIPLPYDPIEDKFAELDELFKERHGDEKYMKKRRELFEIHLEKFYQEKGCKYNKASLVSESPSCRDVLESVHMRAVLP